MKVVGNFDTKMTYEHIDVNLDETLIIIDPCLYFGIILIEPICDYKLNFTEDIDSHYKILQNVKKSGKLLLVAEDFCPNILFSYIGSCLWRFNEINDEVNDFVCKLKILHKRLKYKCKISLVTSILPFEIIYVNF